MAALQDSLARANGRGSAGQCPASHSAKTPFPLTAVRESVCRVAAGVQARATAPALTHPAGASAQPFPLDTVLYNRHAIGATIRGATWRVFWGFGDDRYLGCDDTGECVICTVAELSDRSQWQQLGVLL
jgi:hypothetical protein